MCIWFRLYEIQTAIRSFRAKTHRYLQNHKSRNLNLHNPHVMFLDILTVNNLQFLRDFRKHNTQKRTTYVRALHNNGDTFSIL